MRQPEKSIKVPAFHRAPATTTKRNFYLHPKMFSKLCCHSVADNHEFIITFVSEISFWNSRLPQTRLGNPLEPHCSILRRLIARPLKISHRSHQAVESLGASLFINKKNALQAKFVSIGDLMRLFLSSSSKRNEIVARVTHPSRFVQSNFNELSWEKANCLDLVVHWWRAWVEGGKRRESILFCLNVKRIFDIGTESWYSISLPASPFSFFWDFLIFFLFNSVA